MKRNLVFLCIAVLALPSCSNTFAGLGRDFKSLGQGIENKSYGKTWNGQPNQKRISPPQIAPQQ